MPDDRRPTRGRAWRTMLQSCLGTAALAGLVALTTALTGDTAWVPAELVPFIPVAITLVAVLQNYGEDQGWWTDRRS